MPGFFDLGLNEFILKLKNQNHEKTAPKYWSTARWATKGLSALALTMLVTLNACKKVYSLGEQNTFALAKRMTEANVSALNAATTPEFKVLSFNLRHNDAGDPQSIIERRDLIKQIIVDNNPDVFNLPFGIVVYTFQSSLS